MSVPITDDPGAERPRSSADSPESLSDTLQLVKDYARQETLGPLRGWARYVGYGVTAAVVLGIGLIVLALGVLRLLQTETTAFSGPNTSIVAYVITLAVCVVVIGAVGWQIKRRTTLQPEEDKS